MGAVRKNGRPAKITPALRDTIASALARGNTHQEVAAQAGIGVRTVRTWLARAHKAEHTMRTLGKLPAAERPYFELREAMDEALADADLDALREVMQYVSVGVALDEAANAAGVPLHTLERLQNRTTQVMNRHNDEPDEPLERTDREYLKFAAAFAQASAQSHVKALACVNREMGSDWRAATWWLERMRPEIYANPNRRRQGAGGRPIGATSAPDRPSTADEPPPRIRLREVR